MTARIDLTGKQFNRLTVLGYSHTDTRGQAKWLCRCECGTEKTYFGSSLKKKNTQSCGCLHRDIISGMNNYQAKRALEKHGDYIRADDPWYERAGALMRNAKRNNVHVEFESIAEFALYVKSIAPEKCPVFGVKFAETGNGYSPWSPSIDKIIPEKGYARGNIQIISYMANAMKRDASIKQLIQFAYWILKTFVKAKHA